VTPLVLGALALLLAGPVPALLLRVRRLRHTPAATLLLWQAVALAAVLSALGAGLSVVTLFLRRGAPWQAEGTPAGYAVAAAALAVTGLVLGRLLLSAHRVGSELRSLRRRHRRQVDLVARRQEHLGGRGLHVLEHPVPVAWCLPGVRERRIVVSAGLVEALPPAQVAAVVEHERAHLLARHDLVLEAFAVLQRAFPHGVASRRAARETALLVEVLADRAAAGRHGRRALGEALVTVSSRAAAGAGSTGGTGGTGGTSNTGSLGAVVPAGSLGAGGSGSDLLERVHLLGAARARPVQAAVVAALAVLLVAGPTTAVVLPWLADLQAW
jgi:Zn-dependent protease with chaperone function